MADTATTYPVTLSVDYPDRPLNRLTSFFRLFTAIPILIVIAFLIGWPGGTEGEGGMCYSGYCAVGFVVIPTVLMLLFRRKYPRWWYDWNLALFRFALRVGIYLMLLRDEYPSTDEEQAVHVDIPYPDAKTELNRWLPLVKWFLAIPHIIILALLTICAVVCVIIAWFAILFTGRFPRSLFDFIVGVERWGTRVVAYCFLLTTDRYPPFTLAA